MNGEIGWLTLAERLLISVFLAGIIGIERELHGKTAGLRTHMLVCLGAALFTILSFELPVILGSELTTDPTRIAAQIITGVGFLGAGTILQGRGSVYGLTTAASIWLVAAVGMAAGAGHYRGALFATLLGHIVLVSVHQFEERMLRRRPRYHVVKARLAGETDPLWMEKLVGGLSSEVLRWEAGREGQELRVRVEGNLRPAEVDRLLGLFRERNMQEIQVERR